jgi:hypothetical protein
MRADLKIGLPPLLLPLQRLLLRPPQESLLPLQL